MSCANNVPSITDWMMVFVTIAYVVATVFIFRANKKSAKAAEIQIDEMKRQFAENNRPVIEAEYFSSHGSFFGIRFVNHGNHTAQKVLINLSDEFINSIEAVDSFGTIKSLRDQLAKEKVIGINQHYDLFLGKIDDFKKIKIKVPAHGKITYFFSTKKFETDFYFEFENYVPYTISSKDEDLLKGVNELSHQIRELNNQIQSIAIRRDIMGK